MGSFLKSIFPRGSSCPLRGLGPCVPSGTDGRMYSALVMHYQYILQVRHLRRIEQHWICAFCHLSEEDKIAVTSTNDSLHSPVTRSFKSIVWIDEKKVCFMILSLIKRIFLEILNNIFDPPPPQQQKQHTQNYISSVFQLCVCCRYPIVN